MALLHVIIAKLSYPPVNSNSAAGTRRTDCCRDVDTCYSLTVARIVKPCGEQTKEGCQNLDSIMSSKFSTRTWSVQHFIPANCVFPQCVDCALLSECRTFSSWVDNIKYTFIISNNASNNCTLRSSNMNIPTLLRFITVFAFNNKCLDVL